MSIVEIRAAEGGADAKLLVREQFGIYFKFARRRGL
jgi:protein subunit release factor A